MRPPALGRRAHPARLPPRARQALRWSRWAPLRTLRDTLQLAGKPLLAAELRLEKFGRSDLVRLAGTGPFVVVANHASHLDAVVLLDSLPFPLRRRTAVAAPIDRFAGSWWRSIGASIVFNTVPVDRSDWSLAGEPARLLDRGWNLIVFPEGSRSPDGFPGRFGLDVADLAVATGVPVVPVGIRGAYAAMPPGRGWPTRGRPRISIRWGTPIRPRSGESAAELNTRVATAVARLVEEDATTWWQAEQRSTAGSGPTVRPAPPAGSWRRIWQQSEAPTPGSMPRRRRIWARAGV